ncbi:MAG: PilZ domain-containing protein [Candidatus Omnitrophica bacterium]|nr:PilZ domain-containing protein [Candidatus Omnitrophota bacterium]
MDENRRDFPRFELSGPLRYQRKGSQIFGNSMGKDISSSGIGFASDEFFPVSTQLVFEVQHPKSFDFIKAVGEVVWITSKRYSEKYEVGARFLGPPVTA